MTRQILTTVAVDVVLLSIDQRLEVVLVNRSKLPKCFATPGGYVESEETIKDAACREVKKKTGIDLVQLEKQTYLKNFDIFDGNREIRTIEIKIQKELLNIPVRTISVLFVALVRKSLIRDAKGEESTICINIEDALKMDLAFDHKLLLQKSIDYLITLLDRPEGGVISLLLEETFTISNLQKAYASVNKAWADKNLSNFRRKVLAEGFLEKCTNTRKNQLFRYKSAPFLE